MRSVLFALLAVAACGGDSSSTTTPDAPAPDAAIDAGFAPASHPPAPQVTTLGGPVMTTPKIQPIFFSGDDTMKTQMEGFFAALPASAYWHATTSEYGVGVPMILPTIVATDAPPTTDTALQTWLKASHTGWPAADVNTMFAVFLPAGIVFTADFGRACQSFGGYHDETTTTAGGPLVYALMPRCDSTLDTLTVVTSHEFVEAATDPLPFTQGAYQMVDDNDVIWAFTPGGELGDMCEYVRAAEQKLIGDYVVQRTWSNASAAAGHDPCVPVMPGPYVTATPVFADTLSIDVGPPQGTLMTKGVSVPMGMSKTVDLALWSDAPAQDWTVRASDASVLGGGSPDLTLALDKTTGHNGDVLKLTITRNKVGQNGGSEIVISSRVNNSSVSLWWGFVAN